LIELSTLLRHRKPNPWSAVGAVAGILIWRYRQLLDIDTEGTWFLTKNEQSVSYNA
jgi:hypothetical protein